MPVQLLRVHVNGVLFAAGTITVAGRARVYGAVVTGGTILSNSGGTLEVWYDHDLAQGLYRGVPLVYRAPGAWVAQY
jgi:formylmethanofuran dehydrogenase subunit C